MRLRSKPLATMNELRETSNRLIMTTRKMNCKSRDWRERLVSRLKR
jgi:chromosomal replication initiation ATPase DnaA